MQGHPAVHHAAQVALTPVVDIPLGWRRASDVKWTWVDSRDRVLWQGWPSCAGQGCGSRGWKMLGSVRVPDSSISDS